ncbi:MAG: hypothetical protein V3S89_01345 [Desulfobacterales bacterium]
MPGLELTDQEKAAFHQDITRNRTLDYFYVFDNNPLQFIYRDKLIPGELTDLEERNKTITETLWLDSYHQELVCNVIYGYFYRGRILQMPLQIHQVGAGMFSAPEADTSRVYASADGLRANFDAWMESTGWKLVEDMRKQPAMASWQSLLGVPDRTNRIVSLMPVGNQVVMELICTWTEEGVLQESAWVVVLIYDVDGTVLQDRSYIDMGNWPSANLRRAQARAKAPKKDRPKTTAPKDRPETTGVMDGFYEYNRGLQIEVNPTDLEKRNLGIIEGAWADAQNDGLDSKVFHPDRFRMQLPLQKCSYNLDVSRDVEDIVKVAAPDRKIRVGMTFAKGNQVVAEGVVLWNKDGVATETPFISFLVLDKDGLIIRERRYPAMDNWPGAERVMARLGL